MFSPSKSGPSDCSPEYLGSGRVPGRFARPYEPLPPLPWSVRHPHLATALVGLVGGFLIWLGC